MSTGYADLSVAKALCEQEERAFLDWVACVRTEYGVTFPDKSIKAYLAWPRFIFQLVPHFITEGRLVLPDREARRQVERIHRIFCRNNPGHLEALQEIEAVNDKIMRLGTIAYLKATLQENPSDALTAELYQWYHTGETPERIRRMSEK